MALLAECVKNEVKREDKSFPDTANIRSVNPWTTA
jgi:hypothetical protein